MPSVETPKNVLEFIALSDRDFYDIVNPSFTISENDYEVKINDTLTEQSPKSLSFKKDDKVTITKVSGEEGFFLPLFRGNYDFEHPENNQENTGNFISELIYPLPFINTKSLRGLFAGCSFLEGIPDSIFANNPQLEDTSYCFFNCVGLDAFDKGVLDIPLLKDASFMFCGCEKIFFDPLDNLDGIPLVELLEGCFKGCKALKELTQETIGNHAFIGDKPSLKNANWLFADTSLQVVDDTLLDGCVNLESAKGIFSNSPIVAINEHLFKKTTKIKDLSYAFSNCQLLTDIPEILLNQLPLLEDVSGLFSECSRLKKIPEYLFEKNPKIEKASYLFYKTAIDTIPERLFEKTPQLKDVSFAFSNCQNLKLVPENVFENTLELENVDYAFAHDQNIINVGEVFKNCASLKSMDSTFRGCENLENIHCDCLKNCSSLETFKGVFADCTSLKNIPQNLFKDTKRLKDVSNAFEGCSAIKSVGSGVFDENHYLAKANYLFHDCTSLIEIPRDLFINTGSLAEIEGLVYNCNSLEFTLDIYQEMIQNSSKFSEGTKLGTVYVNGGNTYSWYCLNRDKDVNTEVLVMDYE